MRGTNETPKKAVAASKLAARTGKPAAGKGNAAAGKGDAAAGKRETSKAPSEDAIIKGALDKSQAYEAYHV